VKIYNNHNKGGMYSFTD